MLVRVIADYDQSDLGFAEVVQRIKLHLPDAEPVLTPVPAEGSQFRSSDLFSQAAGAIMLGQPDALRWPKSWSDHKYQLCRRI